VADVLSQLVGGKVNAVCKSLTDSAVSELATEFGGSTCNQTVAAAAREIDGSTALVSALTQTKVLPPVDLPLAPAPYHPGGATARVRLQFKDPVIGQKQLVDVSLRLVNGRWRISGGLDGLFTLLG
jgi:hypothetical protein